ncbi:MAG: hypothetical protein R3C97_13520 [Geminicoccaceae bacterium]
MHMKPLIELIGDDIEIAGIERWLEENDRRLVCASIDEPASIDTREQTVIRLFVIGPSTPARAIGQRLREDSRDGVVTAACVAPDDRTAMSKALALGLDDVLVFDHEWFPLRSRAAGIAAAHAASSDMSEGTSALAPDTRDAETDDRRRRRQLAHLAMLAKARRETVMRAKAALLLRPGEKRQRRAHHAPGSAPSTHVLLVGPPSQAKVRIGEALGTASITHTETVAAAQRLLAHERFDIAILGAHDERSRRTLQAWPCTRRRSDPLVLGIVDRRQLGGAALDDWMKEHGVIDVLDTSMTLEELRLHLNFWQQFACVRKRLIGQPEPASNDEDSQAQTVPGAVSRDLFQAYLEQRRQIDGKGLCPVFTLRLEDLWDIGQEHGYETASALLERMVSSVLESLSLFDLAAYCGNGQLIAMLGGCDGNPLEAAEAAASRALERVRENVGELAHTRPHFSAEPRLLAGEIDLSIQLHSLLGLRGDRRVSAGISAPEAAPVRVHAEALEPA